MKERRDDVDADEDCGRGDEEYEINSMGKPSRTGLPEMVAMVSQHTEQGKIRISYGRIQTNQCRIKERWCRQDYGCPEYWISVERQMPCAVAGYRYNRYEYKCDS